MHISIVCFEGNVLDACEMTSLDKICWLFEHKD